MIEILCNIYYNKKSNFADMPNAIVLGKILRKKLRR